MPMMEPALRAQVEQLYSHHHGWLHGWLRKRLGCSYRAEDLAHDTFTRILSSRDLSLIREPRAYLVTVAKGLLINWYQRQDLERAYLEALAAQPEALAPSEEQRYIILETLREIDALLNALPTLVKRAFLLSQIEGLTYEDIAQRLGVSLVTVKRYMQQAFRHCLLRMG